MIMRFVDMFEPDARHVAANYWQGDLNVWRVVHVHESGALDLLNVSDWRGMRHVNVPASDVVEVTHDSARHRCFQGLLRARRDHANAMRRTREARRDGASDGHAAGTWQVDGNTSAEQARALLESIDAGTDPFEMEYPQTYASDDEKWSAYVEAYDSAFFAEVERAARYIAGDE